MHSWELIIVPADHVAKPDKHKLLTTAMAQFTDGLLGQRMAALFETAEHGIHDSKHCPTQAIHTQSNYYQLLLLLSSCLQTGLKDLHILC
jgi:hypothetical protein